MYLRLSQRLHISWQIAWFSGGVIIGIALTPVVPYGWFASFAWLLIAVCFFGLALLRPYIGMVVIGLMAGVIMGLWRGSVEYADFHKYQQYFHKIVVVQGVVVEDGSYNIRGEQQIALGRVRISGQVLDGHVWVSIAEDQGLKRGDKLTIKGKLNPGFGSMPAAMFRANIVKAERQVPADFARQVSDIFASAARLHIPEPQASLGLGFLLGEQGKLPEELQQQLAVTGLSHIVVASGYNLTILVVLARRLFEQLSKYLAAVGASLMIIGFMAITGLSPSMSRAGLVAGLSLAAWYYGRRIHPLVLLPFAASITVLINPAYIWGDIGWYLSFLAFAGVLVAAPLFQAYFWPPGKKSGLISMILLGTFSAQLLTLPLILTFFGQLPVYALPANMLVLPLVPLAMLLTFVGGLVGLLLPGLAAAVASWPATFILGLMTVVVEWVARWPYALLEVSFPWWAMAGSYMSTGILLAWLQSKTKHSFKNQQKDTILF